MDNIPILKSETETLIRVEMLNLDSTSIRQIDESCEHDKPEKEKLDNGNCEYERENA